MAKTKPSIDVLPEVPDAKQRKARTKYPIMLQREVTPGVWQFVNDATYTYRTDAEAFASITEDGKYRPVQVRGERVYVTVKKLVQQ